MKSALKAPPTSRGEVQFGEGNPRTASRAAPDQCCLVELVRQCHWRAPSGATREALRSRPRRRPRPRIRPRGVMEFWSVGVLRQFGIAPSVTGVGATFRARFLRLVTQG